MCVLSPPVPLPQKLPKSVFTCDDEETLTASEGAEDTVEGQEVWHHVVLKTILLTIVP